MHRNAENGKPRPEEHEREDEPAGELDQRRDDPGQERAFGVVAVRVLGPPPPIARARSPALDGASARP
jgi:hypothetical protein